MNRGHCKLLLPAYLNHGLTPGQRLKVEEHLSECEKCQHALDKLKTKQAREKREALKEATPHQRISLFAHRISKQSASYNRSSPIRGFIVLLLVAAAALWFASRLWNRKPTETAPLPGVPAPIEISSSTATTASVPSNGVAVEPAVSTVTAPATPGPSAADVSSVASSSSSTVSGIKHHDWSGSFSLISSTREVIIQDQEAWRALWEEMGQDGHVPRIDFEHHMVVGLFLGERPQPGTVIKFGAAQDTPSELIIPYMVTEPPASTIPMRSHPFHLMVIPRTDKKIRFSKTDKI